MTQMNFTLRQGDLTDTEAVYRLNRACFSEYWSRVSLFSALESGYDLIVCETHEQAVAYLLSLNVCDEIQIMQIAVSPNYRRLGIASRMTASLIDSVPRASTATLEVRRSNIVVRSLYAEIGFKEVGYRQHYYAPDASGCREDAVLMNKLITAEVANE